MHFKKGSKKIISLLLLIILCWSLNFTSFASPVPEFKWGFNFHTGAPDCNFDLNRASKAFDYILDLGGKFVRTDISWGLLEPTNNAWDNDMIDFFNQYINVALNKGLFVVAILTHPPQWALDLYKNNKDQFWIEYQEYVKKVCELYGDRLYYYQIWNEANHINDPIDAADDWKLFFYGGKTIAQYDTNSYKRIVNVFSNWLDWNYYLNDWVTKAGAYIDVIGIDHYPGTWTATDATDWGPLDWLINYITNPNSPGYNKEGAIMETGYSSWAWLIADEEDQKNWINTALPIIREKIYQHNTIHQNKIILGNFYELIDGNTNGGGNPEFHFGILHSDWFESVDGSKKIGYPSLKSQINSFYN